MLGFSPDIWFLIWSYLNLKNVQFRLKHLALFYHSNIQVCRKCWAVQTWCSPCTTSSVSEMWKRRLGYKPSHRLFTIISGWNAETPVSFCRSWCCVNVKVLISSFRATFNFTHYSVLTGPEQHRCTCDNRSLKTLLAAEEATCNLINCLQWHHAAPVALWVM